jgi:formylglycine-generating enzyme required for sulfatase activity
LTRKQRETRRGRMELLLAERVALWGVKKESRQLPGWWEWLKLLLYTRNKDRTAPQRQMLRAAARKHLLQVGVLLLLLALIGWAVFEVMRGPLKASALVRELALAETVNVPQIIEELSTCRRWADPQLREMVQRYPDDSKQRLHASLALLPVADNQKEYLYQKLLNKTTNPDEFRVICEALARHKHSQHLIPRLWDEVNPLSEPARRFRAACALAKYDPDDPRWGLGRAGQTHLIMQALVLQAFTSPGGAATLLPQVPPALALAPLDAFVLSHEVANWLVLRENPLFIPKWANMLITIRLRLVKSVEGVLRDPKRPESERSLAAARLMIFAGNEMKCEHLMDLVLEADGGVYEELLPWFMGEPREAADQVKKELAREPPANASQKEKDDWARRQAHAAVVLLQLDQRDDHILPLPQAGRIWEMLRQGSDPRRRSYLIHRLGQVGVNPETLLRQYDEVEQYVGARRALLLTLGQFDLDKLPAERRKKLEKLVPRLLRDYRDDPDAGIHSAAGWLLRRWKQEAKLPNIDKELATREVEGKWQWYVTRQGQTLVIVRRPGEFRMGEEKERHRRRIDRTFAIASTEVTLEQFLRFRKDHRYEKEYAPTTDCPVNSVSWYDAAAYCNWLSEQEGIPRDQWCYLANAAGRYAEGMKLAPDFLQRTGYRLPTEAEWEYACRAGATTSRHFGIADAMLGNYAWYVPNSNGRAHPVGTKKPNDFGLFDMYGNAAEWCQDAFAPYPPASGKAPIEDPEDQQLIIPSVKRVLRGGAFLSPASEVRSASRSGFPPNLSLVLAGLRVARTLPPNNSK